MKSATAPPRDIDAGEIIFRARSGDTDWLKPLPQRLGLDVPPDGMLARLYDPEAVKADVARSDTIARELVEVLGPRGEAEVGKKGLRRAVLLLLECQAIQNRAIARLSLSVMQLQGQTVRCGELLEDVLSVVPPRSARGADQTAGGQPDGSLGGAVEDEHADAPEGTGPVGGEADPVELVGVGDDPLGRGVVLDAAPVAGGGVDRLGLDALGPGGRDDVGGAFPDGHE